MISTGIVPGPESGVEGEEISELKPDAAFSLLGNETRIAILRALAAADGPLTYLALHERVDTRDSGQFNYHLDKLGGHFVDRTVEG